LGFENAAALNRTPSSDHMKEDLDSFTLSHPPSDALPAIESIAS
jgi:hypothetical protein